MTKILVIDDLEDILISVKDLLKDLEPEYEVLTAQSGIEGIKLAKSQQPDTILLDIHMPGIDGFEVCKRLRIEEKTKHIPIIFLTGVKITSKDRINGLELGGDAYLTKPFDEGELLANLHAMLRIKKVEDELEEEKDFLEVKVAERTKELRESEARYIDLYENAPDMFASVDAKTTKILQCNQTLVSALGYNKNEIIGQPILFIYHPNCIEEAKKYFQQFVDTGEIHGAELQLKQKDGSKIDVSLNVSAVRDEEGKVLYSRSIWRDITERLSAEQAHKQAEEELRNSERKYKHLSNELETIFDNLPALVFYKDKENRFIRVNKYVADAYEMTKNELEGVNLLDLHTKDQAKAYWADDLKVINSGKPILHVDESWETADGIKWVNTSKIPFVDENGDIIGIIGISIDITERKRLEEKLSFERDEFNSILQELPIGVTVLNSEDKFVYINPMTMKIDGYKADPDRLIGKDVRSNHPKHTLTNIEELLNDFKSDMKSYSSRETKRGKRSIKISYHAIRNAKGEYQGLIRLVSDITERKRAEEVRIESETKFRTLFEDSGDAIYITTVDGFFIDFNQSMEKMLGYNRDELFTLPVIELYANKDDRLQFQQLIESQGYLRDYELQLRKNDGTFIDCLVTSSLRKDPTGNIIGYQGIFRDITERKRDRERLEQALEDAKKGEKVKSLFLSNMSHEIRTPLNSILGFADLIEMSTKDKIGAEEQEFFDSIRKSGERLMHMILEILDMSLIEAKTISVNLEELNLADIVKKAVKPLVSEANAKGLQLNINTGESSGYILADEDCVAKAITNVVENTLKYTETGMIEVDLTERNSTMVLSIKDTGIGIEKEYLEGIFEVFTQESEGYTKKYQGVGLGLALAKKYLELCDATIEVSSKKGIGSTFTMTFKKIKEQSKEKRIEKPVEKTRVELDVSKHMPLVLLVEDDKNSQRLIHFFLKDLYELDFAVSVSEAKEKLKEKKVELVLLDLSLIGDEDGLDLARYMRKTKKCQGIPIIATTAHAFMEDRDKSLMAGCDDYIAKPITKNTLLEKIQSNISLING